MLDVPIEMMTSPSMSELDFALAAGGFEGRDDIDGRGGGAPTASELRITEMLGQWDSSVIYRDDSTILMADGAMFYDSDGNRYYDYLEVAIETGHFVYDAETDTWTWRENNDRDPD